MEEELKPKIALYAKRSFGEKLNVSFDFIKENWKPLFKYTTYLMLPVCIIQALNINGVMGAAMNVEAMQAAGAAGADPMSSYGTAFFLNYGGLMLFSFLGALLMTSLIYALFKLYNEREDRLTGILFSDIRPLLFRNIGRLIVMGLACVVLFLGVIVVVSLLAVLSPWTLFLTFPCIVACILPLSLVSPVYLFEDISFGAAFSKAFRLGFATWGGIFLIVFIMGIIANILQGIIAMPWYVVYFVKMFLTMSDGGEATSPVWLDFVQYVFAIVLLYGAYLSAILGIVGLVFQYGHATEKMDGVTVESDIDNFDKL